MPATILAVADAVVTALADATFSLPFEPARAYIPVYSLDEDFDDLMVTVVPRELSMATLSRRDDDWDYGVDVAVQKRIGRGVATEAEIQIACDPLMALVEEIADLFRSEAVLAAIPARLVGLAVVEIYSPELIDEHRVFTSVLRLTFRKARPR